MIRVLIVDDHALVRLGIKKLLEDVKGIKVIGEVESGETALAFVRNNDTDVVLLDVKMPGIGGLEATRRLLRFKPDLKIIAVTASQGESMPKRVLQAGALGYLTKECKTEEMIQAIRNVFNRKPYISPEIAQSMALQSLSDEKEPLAVMDSLSERELQVLMMITSGLRVPEIARRLCISTKTVHTYRYRLLEKLQVKNDVELTHLAFQHRLLEASDN